MAAEQNAKDEFSYEFLRPEVGGKKLVVKNVRINDMDEMISAKEGLFAGLELTLWQELFKLIDLAPKTLTTDERNTLAGIFYKNFARCYADCERDFSGFMINRLEEKWNLQ